MNSYVVTGLDDWPTVASSLLVQAGGVHTWCLQGDLGVGKTTLVKALCQCLGNMQPVTSPTFSIMHHYDSPKCGVHHVDLYRMSSMQCVLEIGLEELLYGQDYVFIEWPHIIHPLLKHPYFSVDISQKSPAHRTIRAAITIN